MIKTASVTCVILCLCIVGCSNNRNIKSVHYDIIEKVIDSFKIERKLKLDKSFIVNPRLDNFGISSHFATKESSAEFYENVLKEIKMSRKQFDSIAKVVNGNFYNKNFNDLASFSNAYNSKTVIRFSGFYNGLVFMEIIGYCDAYSNEEINSENVINTRYIQYVISTPILFNESGIIKFLPSRAMSSEICLELRE